MKVGVELKKVVLYEFFFEFCGHALIVDVNIEV